MNVLVTIYAKTCMKTYKLVSSEDRPGKDVSVKILRSSNGPSVQELWTKKTKANFARAVELVG